MFLPVQFIKNPILKKYLANLVCASAPAIQSNHQNAIISATTDTRNESGMSKIYSNCSGKVVGGAEYIDLRK